MSPSGAEYIRQIKSQVEEIDPAQVSEHLGIKGGPTQRARTLLRAAGIEDATPYSLSLGSPELLTAKRRRAIIEARDRYSAAG